MYHFVADLWYSLIRNRVQKVSCSLQEIRKLSKYSCFSDNLKSCKNCWRENNKVLYVLHWQMTVRTPSFLIWKTENVLQHTQKMYCTYEYTYCTLHISKLLSIPTEEQKISSACHEIWNCRSFTQPTERFYSPSSDLYVASSTTNLKYLSSLTCQENTQNK